MQIDINTICFNKLFLALFRLRPFHIGQAALKWIVIIFRTRSYFTGFLRFFFARSRYRTMPKSARAPFYLRIFLWDLCCLRWDPSSDRSLVSFCTSWKEHADLLKEGKSTQEEHGEWRYAFPESYAGDCAKLIAEAQEKGGVKKAL